MARRKPVKSVTDVLAQLDEAGKSATLEVEGQRVAVSNLDKPLWPKLGRSAERNLLGFWPMHWLKQ